MKGIDLIHDNEVMESIDGIEIEEKDLIEIQIDSNLKITCELFTDNWEYEFIDMDGNVERDFIDNIEKISSYFSATLDMEDFQSMKRGIEEEITNS